MNISPKQENGIIKLILRDTHQILSNTRNFSFEYASEVKLQKLLFLIAEKLDIPLTRSWYLHGGFIHNRFIKFKCLESLPLTISITGDSDLKKAEQVLSDIRSEYLNLLQELVPKIFFMRLDNLLDEVYNDAPKEYKTMYYTNLAIEREFKLVKNFEQDGKQVWQDSLFSHIPQKDKPEFNDYNRFAGNVSRLILEISNLTDFSCLYDRINKFAEMLDDCLIKMGFLGKKSLPHLKALKNVYERAIWNSIALKISINTVTGVNAESVKEKQEYRFNSSETKGERQLANLKSILVRDNMLPSLDERKRFFNVMYGEDKEFLGAVSNVWKSYKENSI